MPSISTRYMGMELRNPIIAGSSGLTSTVAGVKNMEESGAAAVVLKSIFEEEILNEMQASFKIKDLSGYQLEQYDLYPVAAGPKAFFDKGCEYCHTVSGYGGIRGPDLTYAADRMSEAQMKTRIFSGATNMPSYSQNLTAQQLSTLIAFLESRKRIQTLPAIPGSQ